MKKTVALVFTIEEANYILNSLGNRPFSEVADLISRIKNDAESQLKEVSIEDPSDESVES